jgi:hypothetical protein
MRRGSGWRGWRARCGGLRGLGDCLCLNDERTRSKDDVTTIKGKGARLLRRGIRRYVKVRVTGFRPRRRRRRITTLPNTPLTISKSTYQPSQFRHTSPTQLPTPLSLEIPDLERWIIELWHDFLIEPTPYLVASAICYLGGVLVLVQYYAVIWRVLCFFLQFVPLDDEFGLG